MDTTAGAKMEISNLVIIIVVIMIFFVLMSACCRQIKAGCEEQMTLEELARRRQAFYISGASRDLEERPTRVTAIYQDQSGLALGIYEIHMPHGHQQQQHRGSYPDSIISNSRSSRPSIPPPSYSFLQNSMPITEPDDPPTYDEYLKMTQPEIHSVRKNEPNGTTTTETEDKERY